jgi:4-aminobutyrate aminotransferase/(S)-3-amino-2-methylpropionate transaminase
MREVLEGWQRQWPMVGDVRGLGPMMLVELVADRETKAPLAPADTLRIIRQAVSNGVVLIRAGVYSNCIRFLPPLNMPEDMLREGLKAVGDAITSVSEVETAGSRTA